MKMPVLLLAVVLINMGIARAQSPEKRIAYLSKDRKLVSSPTVAAYYRTVQATGEGFILREYFLPSGKVRVVAECLEYDPEIIFHGKVKHYYESGTPQKEGQYDEGYATGIFVDYYETGNVRERKEYQSDDKELILQHYTPDGRALLTDGNGLISTAVDSSETSYSEIRDYLLVNSYRIKAGDTVYTQVETPAEYPGGMKALMKYLMSNVKYPAYARRNDIQGTVLTSFDIDEKGAISALTTVKGVSDDIDEEAFRVITAMPRWKPAQIKGRPVKSRFVLPIKFKLATNSRH